MLGAKPSRFRKPRVLIVGCGDIGLRLSPLLLQRGGGMRVMALTSSPERVPELRRNGIVPLRGNLDQAYSLRRLSGIATHVVHLAPPPSQQWGTNTQSKDPRTLALVRALLLRSVPTRITYASTSGVYGDCAGEWVSESRPVQPHSARAQRRVDAENALRFFARSAHTQLSVLRIPGIYAHDREGGTPRERLRKGTPVLRQQEDVYTNHIHADDLARACQRALFHGQSHRSYNICDDSQLKMGDYFDLAADLYGLPHPPRIARSAAQSELPLILLSFMSESRRLINLRMKRELKLQLHYPQVKDGLIDIARYEFDGDGVKLP